MISCFLLGECIAWTAWTTVGTYALKLHSPNSQLTANTVKVIIEVSRRHLDTEAGAGELH